MHGALKKHPPTFYYLGSHIAYDKTAITRDNKTNYTEVIAGVGGRDTKGTPTQPTQGNPSSIRVLQHTPTEEQPRPKFFCKTIIS